jgi:hypothetical protein
MFELIKSTFNVGYRTLTAFSLPVETNVGVEGEKHRLVIGPLEAVIVFTALPEVMSQLRCTVRLS